MFTQTLTAGGLAVLTVTVHAVGFAALIRALLRWRALTMWGFWPITGMVIGLTCCLILIHLAEISVWGLFYFWRGCLPDAESAFYFSGAAYTSVGCADLVIPKPWQLLVPLETLTGILMCGLSTGLFFAVVGRWISNWMHEKTALEPHSAAPMDNEDAARQNKTVSGKRVAAAQEGHGKRPQRADGAKFAGSAESKQALFAPQPASIL